jgi:hypothetical protein
MIYCETCVNQAMNKLESCVNQTMNKLESCVNQAMNKLESCVNQALNKLESCVNQALNKVLMKEIVVNLTCLFWTLKLVPRMLVLDWCHYIVLISSFEFVHNVFYDRFNGY